MLPQQSPKCCFCPEQAGREQGKGLPPGSLSSRAGGSHPAGVPGGGERSWQRQA